MAEPRFENFEKIKDSEIVIGLVAAVGTNKTNAINAIQNRLDAFGYNVILIKLSKLLRELNDNCIDENIPESSDEYDRLLNYMNAGNALREKSSDNSILALAASSKIFLDRQKQSNGEQQPRVAYIIDSLKHPDEVVMLREIYPQGFYLLGIYSNQKRRLNYLVESKEITKDDADKLICKDENEPIPYGQKTQDTFHLSDFFVREDGNCDQLQNSVYRFLDLLFGHPFTTPTRDEFSMFIAFTSALRSADLSRQVGASISRNGEILATGANDCPRFGGGLYSPEWHPELKKYQDQEDGRDYKKGFDANKHEKDKIISQICKDILKEFSDSEHDEQKLKEILSSSPLNDITEYGRVVHAEMDAILTCARNEISARDADLFCTTFPCHNCAKHIIAAGIKRVVYIEPYPKSKALNLHADSITEGFSDDTPDTKLNFEPFVGVGPRRFFDLFSMELGSGYKVKRKDKSGKVLDWKRKTADIRIQMAPITYLELESGATETLKQLTKDMKQDDTAESHG